MYCPWPCSKICSESVTACVYRDIDCIIVYNIMYTVAIIVCIIIKCIIAL